MFVLSAEEPDDCKDTNNNEPFFPEPKMTGDLYMFTDRIDELWEAVQGKAKIKSAIANRDHAMKYFSILDNNGFELCFGEDISNRK